MNKWSTAACALLVWVQSANASPTRTLWKFNNLASIGGVTFKAEGHPSLVDSPVGKAVDFNGVNDALFFLGRPLVGARQFSIEVIFKPTGGAAEQRFMHIAETDRVSGLDAQPTGTSDPNARIMFEIRVKGNKWWLDTALKSKAGSKGLANPEKSHPIGRWYAVEQTYDGKVYRSYVNGVLENEAKVPFIPHGPGHTMVGARMNHINYFRGAIALARFSTSALQPREFLKVPASALASPGFQ